MERYYCGDCDREFTPQEMYYGGRNLCEGCREKRSDAIHRASENWTGSSNLASDIEGAVPTRRVVTVCDRCGSSDVDEGEVYCSSCIYHFKNETLRANEEDARREREYRQRLSDLG